MAMSTWSVVVQVCSASSLGRMHLGLFAGICVLVGCVLGHTELGMLTAFKTFKLIQEVHSGLVVSKFGI